MASSDTIVMGGVPKGSFVINRDSAIANKEIIEDMYKIKKNMRDGNTYSKEDIAKELGDCLWYIAALCRDLDINMEDVAEANLEKLRNRMKNDTLSGSGDDR